MHIPSIRLPRELRIVQLLPMVLVALAATVHAADESAAERWLDRFRFLPPPVSQQGIVTGTIGRLPRFEVRPANAGEQLVRVSIPFAPAALPADMGVRVACGQRTCAADLRPLTWHPGLPRSVRRGMVTFRWPFEAGETCTFQLQLATARPEPQIAFSREAGVWKLEFQGSTLRLNPHEVQVALPNGPTWHACLIGPPLTSEKTETTAAGQVGKTADAQPPQPAQRAEIIEAGTHYLWVRLLVHDAHWPRIVEVKIDSLGTVAIEAHLQRLDPGDAAAPKFGWKLTGPALRPFQPHAFRDGANCTFTTAEGAYTVTLPAAPRTRRGRVALVERRDEQRSAGGAAERTTIEYLRSAPAEKVPMQESSWRQASLVFGPAGHTPRNSLLEPWLPSRISAQDYDAVYGTGLPAELTLWPVLSDLLRETHLTLRRSECVGDDAGNLTSFNQGQEHGLPFGMNRLNHCPALFEEAWRSGDRFLRDLAVRWCDNMFDLSLWWGDTDTVGGTRYNNVAAMGRPAHQDDRQFMWRSNSAVHFCTKGYDAFLMAYEETGDPRMAAALRGQVAYARQFVHADQGECRNIGDVADFLRLHAYTGLAEYRQEGLRLFRELREKLSTGDLFSQGGQPILPDGPFINDDPHGSAAPFAKPYILGYALAGLPQLYAQYPNEEKLLDVIRAVARFMASAQDPLGAWRYPHPASARMIIHQALEHAAQLVRAAAVLEARGEPIAALLDAIERALQARVQVYRRSDAILAGLNGWEKAAGAIPAGKTIYDLYAKPADRDRSRDYQEGALQIGSAPPEGLVYLPEVLRFYLAHRPAERLFISSAPLQEVLARVPDRRLRLIPQTKGSFLRIERPEDSHVGFILWAPEWVTLPELSYAKDQLGGMAIDWHTDPATGTVGYTLDRPEASFTASFTPHADYVECTYTSWPKPDAHAQGQTEMNQLGVGPCTQMKEGIFEGNEEDLMNRIWFRSGGRWKSIGSCAGSNPRNVLHLQGHASPEMTGSMAESGWKTIQSPRPDQSLIACTSSDGQWVAATAAEFSNSLCNNSAPSHRCLHSQGSMPLHPDGPTTLRVQVYLMPGGLEAVKERWETDRRRWVATQPAPPALEPRTDTYGLRLHVPTFRDARVARMDFPLAGQDGPDLPVIVPFTEANRQANRHDQARQKYLASLSTPPPRARFAPRVLAVEDRGTYEARKLALNISADCRIKAYLLVPKTAGPKPGSPAPGPCPGLIALHDHGAHFTIGKEKVVRPFGEPEAVLEDARQWVEECYGGRWIGDELARRGYVVLAIDVLFWGDRGRYEGVEYAEQQALASNMLQLGYSWAGYNVWDDIRSAQFLQGLPEVDPDRIGCVGLSMGANRAWHLAAATDIVRAGAAICWLGDTASLTSLGNNQTKGQSAYSMLHLDLRNWLDYADVAALACPKPMLFYNGRQDGLFPVPGVEAAYRTLRQAWTRQGAAERLVCKLWDVPHVFNLPMQQEAFAWLDRQLQKKRRAESGE